MVDCGWGEGVVEPSELFGAELCAEVAIGGGEFGVSEEIAYEHGVGGPGDQAPGGVPQSMEANWAKAGGGAAAFVALAER